MDHAAKAEIARAFEAAAAALEAGRLDQAEQLLRSILSVVPEHFGSLHHLGVLRARQGRLEDALGLLRRAVARDPASAEAHNDAGSVLHALTRHAEAVGCFDKALALDPNFAEAHYNRGTALQALRRHESAIASYEAALAIEPDIPAAHCNLGTALQVLGRHEAAIARYEQAIALEPTYARARAALGTALRALGRHEAAVTQFEQALAADPDLAEARLHLAGALHVLGRHDAAIACFETALARAPDDADAHNNLGLALQAADRHAEAIARHERALAIRPGFAAAINNLGLASQALNRHDEAIAHYRTAIRLGPQNAARHANLGMALQEIGRLDEACGAYETAIALSPRTGRYYRNLADCKRFAAGDPALAAMDALAADRASLPEADRRQLLFALAKAAADLSEYERSFGYLVEGNALQRQRLGYDEAKVLGEFTRVQAAFSAGLMSSRAGVGYRSPVPVFIVGMPRSGTTLIEQILSSHERVFGAGELTDIGDAAAQLSETFPDIAATLPDAALYQFGRHYAETATARARDALRVTDKMPLNFMHLGLIHLALPNARIIHAMRDPVDTCLSCFATLFTGEHRVAYELGELGRYYRAYERLMEHWRHVLPDGAMLEVRYEDVVADVEEQARRIVAHCGLGWDAACLEFHGTPRPVRTASAAQVRRPIYGGSVGRWRAYGHLLQPLLASLAGEAPAAC